MLLLEHKPHNAPRSKLHVLVTEEHVIEGRPEDPSSCPIALALYDLGYKEVAVQGGFVEIWDQDGACYVFVDSSHTLDAFVETFDREGSREEEENALALEEERITIEDLDLVMLAVMPGGNPKYSYNRANGVRRLRRCLSM